MDSSHHERRNFGSTPPAAPDVVQARKPESALGSESVVSTNSKRPAPIRNSRGKPRHWRIGARSRDCRAIHEKTSSRGAGINGPSPAVPVPEYGDRKSRPTASESWKHIQDRTAGQTHGERNQNEGCQCSVWHVPHFNLPQTCEPNGVVNDIRNDGSKGRES